MACQTKLSALHAGLGWDDVIGCGRGDIDITPVILISPRPPISPRDIDIALTTSSATGYTATYNSFFSGNVWVIIA